MAQTGHITLVLGGVKSGKTTWGEACALKAAGGGKPYYLATGIACDDEMKTRIKEHQRKRGNKFITIEEPLAIAKQINARAAEVLVIDSIGTWLTNLLLEKADIAKMTQELLQSLTETEASIIMISEEVGLGIVPIEPLSRQFRDHLGEINQALAAQADQVTLLVAGQAVSIKG